VSPRGNPEWQEGLISFGDGRYSQGLEVGLAVLRAYSPEKPVMGIADIADHLNLTRSTTHKYVVTLEALGLLEQVADRKYRLGGRAADVGMSALDATGLPDPARPYLTSLRDRLGYTVSLAILDGSEIVYVARACSHRTGQYEADKGRRRGSRVPASCTAMGKVLVAGLPAKDERAWTQETKLRPAGPNAIVKKTEFRAELEKAREQGFAVNNRELVGNMVAVAVPVLNKETVSAAIGVAANAKLISVSKLAATCRDELLAAASDVAEHVNYNPQRRWLTT
jgi:IclR family pca regulon transcriptional regulator